MTAIHTAATADNCTHGVAPELCIEHRTQTDEKP